MLSIGSLQNLTAYRPLILTTLQLFKINLLIRNVRHRRRILKVIINQFLHLFLFSNLILRVQSLFPQGGYHIVLCILPQNPILLID